MAGLPTGGKRGQRRLNSPGAVRRSRRHKLEARKACSPRARCWTDPGAERADVPPKVSAVAGCTAVRGLLSSNYMLNQPPGRILHTRPHPSTSLHTLDTPPQPSNNHPHSSTLLHTPSTTLHMDCGWLQRAVEGCGGLWRVLEGVEEYGRSSEGCGGVWRGVESCGGL